MRVTGFVLLTLLAVIRVSAHESNTRNMVTEESALSGIFQSLKKAATQTLGGRQFWGDIRFFRGWRIQENVFTDHCRLLNPQNHRHSHGTLKECESALAAVRKDQHLLPMTGRAVILVHGLIRSSRSFNTMASALESEGCMVVRFDYPSTRSSIPDAADRLSQVINSLEGVDTIDLVVHSMGGLIMRCCFRDHVDERIRRAVLLGVPNYGATIADRLHTNPLFRALYGPAGQQLISEQHGLIAQLPAPACEFGIIAGGRGTIKGFNPLLQGDNDSTVTVHSARLKGATDFILQPVIHSFLMTDPRCISAVATFLQHGRFDLEREPQPIR